MPHSFKIKYATKNDIPIILDFIRQLAEYENLSKDLEVTANILEENLFGNKSYAEVILGFVGNTPVSYALFIHNFSTLLGKPGLYLVDLFVINNKRKIGIGRKMLAKLANIALERGCGRLEWSVLKWNQNAISLYKSVGATEMNEWATFRITKDKLNNLAKEFSIEAA